MDSNTALAILKQAKADDTYEGPIPEDEAKLLSEAQNLVEMAETAWAGNVRGPEVEKILKLAAAATNGDDPEKDDEPETEPEAAVDEDAAKLAELEPWDDYNTEKPADIKEAILEFQKTDDDFMGLLAHVEAYETAHKGRVTVLRFLETFKETDAPEEKSPPAQAGEDTPAEGEAGPGDEAQAEGGEGDGEEAEDADRDQPDAEDDADDTSAEPQSEGSADEEAADGEAGSPDESDDDYRELITSVERQIANERFHTPPKLTESPSELPFDMTTLTDKQLQQLYGEFTAYAYRAGYLERLEESKARICRNAANEMRDALIAVSDKIDPQTDKPKTMTIIEAEVEQDTNVKKWRKRQHRHEAFQAAHKADRENYIRIVDSLSRLESMRHQEFERSGGKTGRSR